MTTVLQTVHIGWTDRVYEALLFLAQKIKTAEVIKYHQNKAIFVGKKGSKFCLGATPHDRAIVS